MAHAIGIDVGSTNVKVALVDAAGGLVAAAARPLTSTVEGDRATQDPGAIWAAVVDALRELTAAEPVASSNVVAIGLAGQYSSTIPVDAHGEPTGPCVLYLDHRGTSHSRAIFTRHPDAFTTWVERHGIPPVGNGLSLAHILHFQHDEPAVHAATHAYLEAMDYVAARLTGRIAATQATMFTTQLCDNRTVGITEYDADLVAMSGVDPSRLPPLQSLAGTHGTVRDDIAAACGLPAGVVVATPMNDSHAGALATSAATPGTVGVMIGTTAVVLDVAATKRADFEHELLTMPAPDGHHLVWAENGLAGRAVEHVLAQLGWPFTELDAALDASAPGADGVLFLPWLAGSMSPAVDPAMRGGFLGLSLTAGRADLVRACLEGTAHNLAWLLRAVEGFTGTPTERVVFGGGAARSAAWAQLLADVLDRPVVRLADPEVAVARTLGAVALERVGALEAGGSTRGPLASEHRPDPGTRAVYATHQTRFEAAFAALRPIWQADQR